MDQDERDQFKRIELIEQIERAQAMIKQYFEGIQFYVRQIAESNRMLGAIDQRLGG